jgi:internalin A
LICAVVVVGCGGDPNKKANELFVEAVQLIGSAEKQTGEAAIKDYEQALGKLREIITKYMESDLCDELISGERLIMGRSLQEIKERVKELKLAEILTKADLEKVTTLSLYGKRPLNSKRLTKVPKGLEKLDQLTNLNLRYNRLTDVSGLEKLTKLTHLVLDHNQLTDVKGLEKLTQLKELELQGNQLTSVKGLEKLTQLTYLDLENNPALTKVQIAELKKALPKCHIQSNPTK